MSSEAPKLHVHVWDSDENPDEPVEEKDLDEPTGEYDDHYQYSFQLESVMKGSQFVELRVMKPSPDEVYTDWEGLTSKEDLADEIGWIRDQFLIVVTTPEHYDPVATEVADLTLHWVYENVDQADYRPTQSDIQNVYWAFWMLKKGGRFMPSGIDWQTGTLP